jgi:hypothetical protein
LLLKLRKTRLPGELDSVTYWKDKAAAASNLRLLIPGEGWKNYADVISDNKVEQPGSKLLIESAFLNALNSTNLILLTGTGSSFSVKNAATKPQPAGMTQVWSAVEKKVGEATFKRICDSFASATIDSNIERLLTLCKLHLELHEKSDDELTAAIRKFVKSAEAAILETVDFVDKESRLDAHAAVIQKIGRRGARKSRARIFTTNYDLCYEEAARRHRFTVIDGFSHSLEQVYDRIYFDYDIVRREQGKDTPDYIESVFHLYKLHGSIDWRRIGNEIIRTKDSKGEPVLIYPRSSKYQESFEAPYLDMIGALQAALREPDTAVVVAGFGFNDDHVSRPILSAVETNMSLRLVICDPVFLNADELEKAEHVTASEQKTANRFLSSFLKLAKAADPRIHLINGRFEDMALALPDLVGETDRERHLARVRALREGEHDK